MFQWTFNSGLAAGGRRLDADVQADRTGARGVNLS
jgi:hypothetical protein